MLFFILLLLFSSEDIIFYLIYRTEKKPLRLISGISLGQTAACREDEALKKQCGN
jgi:hypothetical protein